MSLRRASMGQLVLFSSLALLGCPKSKREGAASGSSASAATNVTPPTATTCSAPGLGNATPLVAWQPEGGCKLAPIPAGPPKMIHAEAELAGVLDCAGRPSGIDFKKNTLVVVGRIYSPAQMGVDIFDDGKKVTFVSRFRIPCTGDPKPMPVTVPVGFMLPADATRTFGEAQCTQLTPCP